MPTLETAYVNISGRPGDGLHCLGGEFETAGQFDAKFFETTPRAAQVARAALRLQPGGDITQPVRR